MDIATVLLIVALIAFGVFLIRKVRGGNKAPSQPSDYSAGLKRRPREHDDR